MTSNRLSRALLSFLNVNHRPTSDLQLTLIIRFYRRQYIRMFKGGSGIALMITRNVRGGFRLLGGIVRYLMNARLPLCRTCTSDNFKICVILYKDLVMSVIPLRRTNMILKLLVVKGMITRRLTRIRIIERLGNRRQIRSFLLLRLVCMLLKTSLVNVFMMIKSASTGRSYLRIRYLTGFLTMFVRATYRARTAMLKVSGSFSTVGCITFQVINIGDLLTHGLNMDIIILRVVMIRCSKGHATRSFLIGRHRGLSLKRSTCRFFCLFIHPRRVTSI